MKIDGVYPIDYIRIIAPPELKMAMELIKDRSKTGRLHIVIEPERRKRSTGLFSQNHHLNGHIQQIANETGEDFNRVKHYVKELALKRNYPIKVDVFGNSYPQPESESSVEECILLIDSVHELADFMDIRLREEN